MAQRDKICEALATATFATVGAAILAVPWFGFLPLAAVCTGVVVATVAFKAATSQHDR